MIKSEFVKHRSQEYFVSLGFPEFPQKGDFDYENFPSKLGGLPVWLIPPDLDDLFFSCFSCNKNLYFLLQIYCPLEENVNSFHRVLYIFFCIDCWKKTNAIKVVKVQLPNISEFYKGEQLLMKKEEIEKNENFARINKMTNCLYPEYLIDSSEEIQNATQLYVNFYDNVDEKSLKNKSYEDLLEVEDSLSHESDEHTDKMLENYCKEQGITIENVENLEDDIETEFINKVEKNIFNREITQQDVFYELFSKVVTYDPKQVVRYCREGIYPLWYCSNGMLSMKNTKCKNCGGELIFELQVN